MQTQQPTLSEYAFLIKSRERILQKMLDARKTKDDDE